MTPKADIIDIIQLSNPSALAKYHQLYQVNQYYFQGEKEKSKQLLMKISRDKIYEKEKKYLFAFILLSRLFFYHHMIKESVHYWEIGEKIKSGTNDFENILLCFHNCDLRYYLGEIERTKEILSKIDKNIRIIRDKGGKKCIGFPPKYLEAMKDLREGELLLDSSKYDIVKSENEKLLLKLSRGKIEDNIFFDLNTSLKHSIGKSYYFLHDYISARKFFKQVIKGEENVGRNDLRIRAKIYEGRMLYYERKYREALKIFEECLNHYQQVKDEYGISKVNNELGRLYLSIYDYQKALECHNLSLDLAKKYLMNFEIGRSYLGRGICYLHLKKFSKCESELNQANDVFNRIQNLRYRSRVIQYLGDLEFFKGNAIQADNYYTQLLSMMSRETFPLEVAIVERHMARNFAKNSDLDKSLEIFKSSIKVLYERKCYNSKIHLSKALNDNAILIQRMPNNDENTITDILKSAKENANKIGNQKELLRTKATIFLIYIARQDYIKAFDAFDDAFLLSRKIDEVGNDLHLFYEIIREHMYQFNKEGMLNFLNIINKFSDLKKVRFIKPELLIIDTLKHIYIEHPKLKNNMRYELKIKEFEEKLQNKFLKESDFRELDDIRLYAIGVKSILPQRSSFLLGRCQELMLGYIDVKFMDLFKKMSKPIPTYQDDYEKMRLYHLELRLKNDDPRSYEELDEEYRQIRADAEEFSHKVMGSLRMNF